MEENMRKVGINFIFYITFIPQRYLSQKERTS